MASWNRKPGADGKQAGLYTLKARSGDLLPLAKLDFYNSPNNSATNWALSVQTHEPMGDISVLIHISHVLENYSAIQLNYTH